MENLNNIDYSNEKPHPKPTDDPGAEIETVTPDSDKGGLTDDPGTPPKSKDELVKKSEFKVDETLKGQENIEESWLPEIETVTPDSDNKDLSDDGNNALEDISDHPQTDEQENDANAENPDTSKDKKEEDGSGIETVTPDSHKAGLTDDPGIPSKPKYESVMESEVKVDETSKSQENSEESSHPEIETVTLHSENKDLPANGDSAPEDSIDTQETGEKENNENTENPDMSQDKNEEDGSGIETVMP